MPQRPGHGYHAVLPPEVRLFAVTGFLGGLTTFSTFSAEVVIAGRPGAVRLGLGRDGASPRVALATSLTVNLLRRGCSFVGLGADRAR